MIHELTWVLPRSHCSAKPASSAPLIIILGIFCPTLPLLTKIDTGAFLLIWGSIFCQILQTLNSFLQILTLRSSAHFIRYLLWNYRHQFPNMNFDYDFTFRLCHLQKYSNNRHTNTQNRIENRKPKKTSVQAGRLDFHIWEYLKKQSQAREGKNQITDSNWMREYFNNKHGSKEKHTNAHQHQHKNLCPSSHTGDSGRGRRKAPLMRSRTGTFWYSSLFYCNNQQQIIIKKAKNCGDD